MDSSMSRARFPMDSWRPFFRRGPLAYGLFNHRSDPSTGFLCFQDSVLVPWVIEAMAFKPLLALSASQTHTPPHPILLETSRN